MPSSIFKPGADSVATAVTKADFKQREKYLHTNLLRAQQHCRLADKPVLILVSGVEAAGKSEVVNRLSSWLDMRYVRTFTYWQASDEETGRPRDWRYWRDLPGKGELSILFSSWYIRTIMAAIPNATAGKKRVDRNDCLDTLKLQCEHINRFERLLVDEGVVLIKLWFHLGKKAQKKRLQKKIASGHYVHPYESLHARYYEKFVDIAEQVVKRSDSACAPWHIIQAEDPLGRDLQAGDIILQMLQASSATVSARERGEHVQSSAARLQRVVHKKKIPARKYSSKLEYYQRQLAQLHWRCWDERRSTVLLFEGWDAAGKGGAIRRLTAAMDARLYRVIPIAAPTDEERAHHYLWRFWRQVPRDGCVTIYDRSWYGRVLVERVEGFADALQWQHAYTEINDFEQQLCNHGIRLIKFWLHITPEEQLRRFRERQQLAHKRHKLGAEDWRNRERWPEYEAAVEDMLECTGTEYAPWHVVAANDKQRARIDILKIVCRQLQAPRR